MASIGMLSLMTIACSGNQGQNNVSATDAAEVSQLDSARMLSVDSTSSFLGKDLSLEVNISGSFL